MCFRGILVTLLVLSGTAFARGNEGGGGGKGSVCRKADGSIDYVHLLDLWEAEMVWRREVVRTNEPIEVQFERAIDNLMNAYDWKGALTDYTKNPKGDNYDGAKYFKYELMQEAHLYFLRIPKNTGPNGVGLGTVNWMRRVNLEETPDSFERVKPRDCPVEQIVRYEDDLGIIQINLDLVEKMPVTDQAALAAHEVFYNYLRKKMKNYREENSLRVRRAIGLVFSGFKFATIESKLPKEKIKCYSLEGTLVYLVPFANTLDNNSMTCYYAAASMIQNQPVLGAADFRGGACPQKTRDGDNVTYMTVQDFRNAGYYSKKETVAPKFDLLGHIFGKPSPPPVKDDRPMGYWSLVNGGRTSIIEPGAVGTFDREGIAVPRYSLNLYATKSGLRGQVLNSKSEVIVDDMYCN